MPNTIDEYHERTTYLDRDYQTFSLIHQINLAPVDDDEESRLRDQHLLLLDIFRDRQQPLLPDVVREPEDILECGFGSGDWAYEVADELPDCKVHAVDISPIMELAEMPDNLVQEIVDLNDPFTFSPASFDFVHSRFVAGGIAHSRWPSYLSDIKKVLRPNSYVELVEWELIFRSDHADSGQLAYLQQWSEAYLTSLTSASGSARKSRSIPQDLEAMLRMAGFVNVQSDIREIPTCGWSQVSHKKRIGDRNEINMRNLIRNVALYPVTSRNQMPYMDFLTLVDRATEELGNHAARPYLRLYAIHGRKP